MEAPLQDIRLAVRRLLRSPGFTITAVLTLGLGIGADTAVFSVVNGVLWQRLPYRDPERLTVVWGTNADGQLTISERERLRYREQTNLFERFGTYVFGSASLRGHDGAEKVQVTAVDADVFPTTGVAPVMGRTFAPEEDRPGGPPIVILSHALWQRRFGASSTVLDSSIQVDGGTARVIGVMPAGFRLPGDFVGMGTDLYQPLGTSSVPDPRNLHYLRSIARMAPGVAAAPLEARLLLLSLRLREEIPSLPRDFRATAVPVQAEVLGQVRPLLLLLLGAVALVLLIACVNVANLMLARHESRRRDIAVRVALGAGQSRLVGEALAESVTLGLAAGALGLVLASWALRALEAWGSPSLPRLDAVRIDGRVFAFTFALSILTGLLFGAVPALLSAGRDVAAGLREGGRGATTGNGRRVRRALLTAELALAVMLAIGAGLLVHSYVRLQSVDAGVLAARALTLQVTTPSWKYPDAASERRLYATLLDRIRVLPSVSHAGAATHLPLAGAIGDWGVRIEGREEERLATGRRPWADWVVVTDGYFEALGAPLRDGRLPTAADDGRATPVVVISETMARRYWPGASPLGKRFKLSSNIDTVYRSVIGVVADLREPGLDAEPRPTMYLPEAQFPATVSFPVGAMSLVLRTAGDPVQLARPAQRAIQGFDPDLAVSRIRTLHQVRAQSTASRRLNAVVFTVFGGLALALMAVGVFGVMAYLVAQRTREMGIRIALGATPHRMLRLVVGQTAGLAVQGVVLGVIGALALSRLLQNLLFAVGVRDAVSFVGIPLLVTAVALLACYIPARRAARVDPMVALRTE